MSEPKNLSVNSNKPSSSSSLSSSHHQYVQQQQNFKNIPPPNMFSDYELEAIWQQIKDEKDDIIWRDWFLTKIDKMLDMSNNPVSSTSPNTNQQHPTLKNVTVIFGHAGSGKTFLMQLLSQMSRFQDRILLSFYCKFHTSSTPSDFLSDLERKMLEFFHLRTNSTLTTNNSHNCEQLLRQLNMLDNQQIDRHQLNRRRLLLLIDSIDLRPDICDLISTNLLSFPSWLHVIITARPKRYRGITKMFSGARKIVLDDIKKTNVYNDIMNYLVKNKHRLVMPDNGGPNISKHLLNRIVNKSNGSILYVKILIDCIERGIFDPITLDFVGATLNGLYLAIFTALFNANPQMESDYKAVLSVIDRINCFQISIAELRCKLNIEEDYLVQVLEHLSHHCVIVFSDDGGSHIRLIHSSLFEWLSDIKHCSSRFICHSYFSQQPQINESVSTGTNKQNQRATGINNKYVNDNDDSINDVSDDLPMFETNTKNQNELLSIEHNIIGLERKQAKGFKSEFAFFDHDNSVGRRVMKADKYDDDCLINSDGEPHDNDQPQLVDLSKQDVSKEYLNKLCQKFENALQMIDLKTLHSILSRYANLLINQSMMDGKTPLYWGIKKSNIKLVELLVDHGADVNAVCDPQWGYSPLIVALMQHSYDMCELLLENDADVELLDRYSMPPILHAILVNCSPEIIKLLLYWGAHTDFIDEAGRSLLHFAANESKTWPETISLLLTVGCDEMHRDNDGQTALHMAAASGSLESVEVLVEFGNDKLIHTQDKSGMLPLHVAVSKNNSSVCEPLITNKSINMLAHSGNSPLRIAILSYYLDLAQILILKGADINYKDADGRSIIYCVVAFTHSTLEQKGPPFFNVSTLYKNGPEEYLDTAVKTIEFLARFGIDLEIKDLEGRTALHVAAWQGTYLLVESLIQLGSDINAIDNEGRTPLHMCSWNGHIEVVRMLVEAGAQVNHVSSTQGATPLLVAAQQGHLETCVFLMQVGSNITHRDLYGRDARDVAINCGHTEIVNLIETFMAESSGTNTLINAADHADQFTMGSIGVPLHSSSSMKLSKYDPRFYSNSTNSVPNEKGKGGLHKNSSKKNKSISKLSKMLH